MKNLKLITTCLLILFTILFSSCTAIAGIFKTGMGVGIFLAVVVVIIVIAFIARSGGNKN